MKTIYTSGVFDLFHYGHVRMLKKCEELAFNMQHKLNEKLDYLLAFIVIKHVRITNENQS